MCTQSVSHILSVRNCCCFVYSSTWVPTSVRGQISEWKPSWPGFGNKCENNRRATRLSHYGPQTIYPLFSSPILCLDFILKSVCSYLSFRRNKKLPPGGKSKNKFLKCISRLQRDMMFLSTDSESAHKVRSICKFS